MYSALKFKVETVFYALRLPTVRGRFETAAFSLSKP